MKRVNLPALHSLLPDRYQYALRTAAAEDLDAVINRLRKLAPQYFHVEYGENQTLRMREFFDEPHTAVPCLGWRRANPNKRGY